MNRPDPARPGPARPGRNALVSRFLKLYNSESIEAICFKLCTVVDTSLNCILSNFGGPHSNIIDTNNFLLE